MQGLRKDLGEFIEKNTTSETEEKGLLYPELQEVAQKWAAASLRTYSGERLKKALHISAALSEFAVDF